MFRSAAAILALLGIFGSVRAAPPIEAYGRLPGVEFMRLSPSGERYATIAVVGEERRLIVAAVGSKSALYADRIGDAKVRQIQWAGEDHILVTFTATFKAPIFFRQAYELAKVINVRLSDRNISSIFERTPSIADVVLGYYGSAQVDGHLYGYFGGITYAQNSRREYIFEHGYEDLYRVDLDTGKATLAAKGNDRDYDWVMARDGTMIAHSEYEQKGGTWRLFAGKDRDKLLMEKTSALERIGLAGQGRTPGTVLIVDKTGDRDVEFELSAADGRREELFATDPTDGYLHDPDTGHLVGALTTQEPYAAFFDARLQARFNATRKAFPGYQVRLESFSRNLDRVIAYTDGGDDSGTFWVVDLDTKKADPLGYAYPTIQAADVGPTKLVRYKSADGVEIEGVLTLPPGRRAGKPPVVILPHGGPIDVQDRLGFDWWAQAYASAGYAVFQPNYRGSAGYSRAFREAAFGQWGRKMQTDLSDGLAALAAQGIVDPKRACIVGASYGGYAALAGVTLQHGLYRCAVSVSGPSDMSMFFHWEAERHSHDSSSTRYWRAVTNADKEGDDAMRDISPARFAGKADAPILLIHGEDDTVVPIKQSEKMESELKSAGKPVEFVRMKGEDHWLSRETTRTTMLKAAVAFVKQHNPPD